MYIASRRSIIGALAVLASLSAPLAFAQDTATAQPGAVEATDNAAAVAAPAPAANDAAAAAPAAAKKSWSDVDTDNSGSLTPAEAAAVPALAEVFDAADTDADGSLTVDEYKAYAANLKAAAGADGAR